MCQFKHPAALIIKDWLDGNRAFLPANSRQLQTIPPVPGGKVMSKISKRVSKYLIARQQRAARLKPLGRPWMLAFLKVSRSVRPSTAVVWKLTEETAALLSGDVDQDRELIRSLLEASSKSRKQIERQLEYGEPDAFNR
jgi:hypothetical protein